MEGAPHLVTERLMLRPFVVSDAKSVQRLAGDVDVARTTLRIPHPYADGLAEAWIGLNAEHWADGKEAEFAAVDKEKGTLIGAVGLMRTNINPRIAELGYWIGRPFWNKGYGTEAARAVLAWGFSSFSVDMIVAHHFADNPASGRVMVKIGMKYEGVLPRHVEKWGEKKDLMLYGLSAKDFRSADLSSKAAFS